MNNFGDNGDADFRIHWNLVYWGTGLSYSGIRLIFVIEFGILKHWTFVYVWFVYWNFVYWSTGLLFIPNSCTGISYIEWLDFCICQIDLLEFGILKKLQKIGILTQIKGLDLRISLGIFGILLEF